MHGVLMRTVSLNRHSLSAKPFVTGAAAAEPPTGSGLRVGELRFNFFSYLCLTAKVGSALT